MASLEAFDRDVKELVNSNKLSSSRIKAVTDAAMANIASDAHVVATLFKVHKQAKSTHKISSLYVIDAIAREARQQAKKAAKGKGSSSNTPLQDGADTVANDDSDDFSFEKRKGAKGTYASFLSKVESFLDRLVAEVLTKGPPEHKEKVKKVVDIWKKSATFSSEALKPCYARLSGELPEADAKSKKNHAKHSAITTQRSTTPPYAPPDIPILFPQFPPLLCNPSVSSSATPLISSSQTPQDLAALLGSINASSLNLPPSQGTPPMQPPAPNFELSQLALLQQLAAQTNVTAPFAPPAHAVQPAQPVLLPQQSQPQPPLPSTSQLHNNMVAQQQPQAVNNWSTAPTSAQFSRERSPQREGPRQSQWDRGSRHQADGERQRSASPCADRYSKARARSPPRRSSPPRRASPSARISRFDSSSAEQDRSRPLVQEFRPPRKERPRQQETRQIATYISDDRTDSRPAAKGKDNRYAFESDDFSAFEVRKTDNTFEAPANQTMSSYQDQQWSQAQNSEVAQAPDLLTNAAAFNAGSFNPLEPESWASFAVMCQGNIGRLPTNMEMMQWIMTSMAMMQASATQMGGMDSTAGQQGMQEMIMQGGQGNNSMSNMQQGMFSQGENNAQGNLQAQMSGAGNSWHNQQFEVASISRESSIEPDRRPPPPSRDDGEGEADMQMTPEPDQS